MTQPIPPDIGIEADPILGEPLASYPSNRGKFLIVGGGIVGVVSVILNFTTATLPSWWGPAITVILMAGVALAIGWYILHLWNREVILYEQGFSYREGSNTAHFKYDEIRSLQMKAERKTFFGGLFRSTFYRFTLRTIRDEVITINNIYRHVATLGDQLSTRIFAVLQPRIQRQLANGDTVEFGALLRLGKTGMMAQGKHLLWDDYTGVKIADRQLHIQGKEGTVWFSFPLSELENAPILLEILRDRKS